MEDGDRWVTEVWGDVRCQRHVASYVAKSLRRKRKRVIIMCLHSIHAFHGIQPMLYYPRIQNHKVVSFSP